ncbi:unnamed protein product [Bemisia tabaci]|uniref:SAM domain-containing protein n=1 Tax=Bemisia tabaci TaxID=7038 RepID=A0A9P0A1C2_BEMTA|nr:unnamed protein product [Bemisia tabaci]
MFVTKFLGEIGLTQYQETFDENGINSKDLLLLLTDKEVRELIPQMGHRLIFWQAFVKLQSSQIDPKEKDVERESCEEQLEIQMVAPGSADPNTFILPVFEVTTPPQAKPSTPKRPKSSQSPKKVSRRLNLTSPRKGQGVLQGRVTKSPKKAPFAKHPLIDQSTYIEDYDVTKLPEKEKEERIKYITDILETTLDGKTVLRSKEIDRFDDVMRKYLVDCIINHELKTSSNIRILPDKFKYLATAIKIFFPSESPYVYYTPGVSLGKGKKINPRGKLFETYSRKRRVFTSHGLCETSRRKGEAEVIDEEVDVQLTEDDKAATDEIFAWLKLQSDPYEEVESKWKVTADFRIKKFQNSNETAAEYMGRFAALRKDFGQRLLKLDFQFLYPLKEKEFINKWPLIGEKIIDYTKARCQQSSSFKLQIKAKFPTVLTETLCEEERNFAAISLLPFLVKPGELGSKRTYTQAESLDTLIFTVKTPDGLKAALLKRNETRAKAKTPIQPSLIFVGSLPTNFDSYCEVHESLYSASSIIDAIDICFKSFFALNLKYPSACARVWHFIQRYVYNITVRHEKADPNVDLLATHLNLTSE